MAGSFLERVAEASQKLGSQHHLRSLRDSFLIAIPFLVLAGLFIMINFVLLDPKGVLENILMPETFTTIREIGDRALNGTMNILSIMLAVLVAFNLATKKQYSTPIIPAMVSLACFFVFMPLTSETTPLGMDESVTVSGYIPYALTNAGGVFLAIITAFISTSIFLKISESPKFQINLGDEVPPMVAQSFMSLFAILITVALFALTTFLITHFFNMEVYEAIQHAIQAPLVHLTTSLPGFLTLSFVTNTLFALGIHPSGIVNPILEPPLLVAMQENATAFANGLTPPHIIVLPFRDLYGHIGGTGSTLGLILAVFMKSRMSSHRKFAKTISPPLVFHINEPIIFGFPVIFNPLIMIPFIFYPLIAFTIAYYATAWGFVSPIVVYTPWSVPAFLSGWLASGGDFRNVILQVILVAGAVIAYLPFLIAYERMLMNEKKKKLVDDLVAHAKANGVELSADVENMTDAEIEAASLEQEERDIAKKAAAQANELQTNVVSEVKEDTVVGATVKVIAGPYALLEGKNILLSCNEGMSTSMMAKRMQKFISSQDINAKVYAVNVGSLEKEYEKASIILLGPQLAYMQKKIEELVKGTCPVEPIDPKHFSTMNGQAAIERVIEVLNTNKE